MGSAGVGSVTEPGLSLVSITLITGAGLITVTVTSNELLELPAKVPKLASCNTIAQISLITWPHRLPLSSLIEAHHPVRHSARAPFSARNMP